MPCIYLDTGFLLYCQECLRYLWVFRRQHDSTSLPICPVPFEEIPVILWEDQNYQALSWIHTSCARIRAHTLNRSYSQRTVLRAYIAYTCVCARTYAEEFNLVELSRPALIFHPIKCVCEGHAQPTDIDAMVICTRIRSYLKFTTHLRGAILALGVAQRGAYARTKYESSLKLDVPQQVTVISPEVPPMITSDDKPSELASECIRNAWIQVTKWHYE